MDKNRQDGRKKKNIGGNGGGFPQVILGILIAIVAASFIYSMIFSGGTSRFFSSNQSEISYSEFLKKVDEGKIYKVRIGADDIYAYEKGEEIKVKENLEAIKSTDEHNFIVKINDGIKNLYADKDRLEQVILNICSNANKYAYENNYDIMCT